NQPKYQFLQNLLDSVGGIGYFPFYDNEQVVLPLRPGRTLLLYLMMLHTRSELSLDPSFVWVDIFASIAFISVKRMLVFPSILFEIT
ncbi:hypothetical protein DD595_25685, partial [Enterobacter cloacae complex sp. 4DZ3-17B2]